jgi:hypothetical protein
MRERIVPKELLPAVIALLAGLWPSGVALAAVGPWTLEGYASEPAASALAALVEAEREGLDPAEAVGLQFMV